MRQKVNYVRQTRALFWLSLVVIIIIIAVCFEILRYYVLRDTAIANGFQYNSGGMANQQ